MQHDDYREYCSLDEISNQLRQEAIVQALRTQRLPRVLQGTDVAMAPLYLNYASPESSVLQALPGPLCVQEVTIAQPTEPSHHGHALLASIAQKGQRWSGYAALITIAL
jgi:hypothetical protein